MKPILIIAAMTAALALSPTLGVAKGAGNGGCPPGLAKKNPPCVPPGLAKKGVERGDVATRDDDSDRDDDSAARYVRLEPGDRVDIDGVEYVVISTSDGILLRRDEGFYRLPARDDSNYVRIGDALIRVSAETQAVIDTIRLVDLLLN